MFGFVRVKGHLGLSGDWAKELFVILGMKLGLGWRIGLGQVWVSGNWALGVTVLSLKSRPGLANP